MININDLKIQKITIVKIKYNIYFSYLNTKSLVDLISIYKI